jgi:hypothetical protein
MPPVSARGLLVVRLNVEMAPGAPPTGGKEVLRCIMGRAYQEMHLILFRAGGFEGNRYPLGQRPKRYDSKAGRPGFQYSVYHFSPLYCPGARGMTRP